jgi:asparagine synthase (glutamine-hydrolysing)
MTLQQDAMTIVDSLLAGLRGLHNKKITKLICHVDEQGLSYLGKEALSDLARVMGEINEAKIPGTVIETGCALGGSAIILAAAKGPTRPLQVYDVFGMIPAPTAHDGEEVHQRYETIRSGKSEGLKGHTYYGYQSDLQATVIQNFHAAGYSPQLHNVHFIKGLYENTLYPSGPVALAHIDCDWYQSVKTCLERIAPHISPGGRMIIDDYDHYSGCRRAVDEFLEASNGQFIRERYARVHLVRTMADGQETNAHRPGD